MRRLTVPAVLVAVALLAAMRGGTRDPGADAPGGETAGVQASVARSADAESRLDPLAVEYAESAFGRSGAVRARFVLPGRSLELPLEWIDSRPATVEYGWRPALGSPPVPQDSAIMSAADRVVAPAEPGVYELWLRSPDSPRKRLRDLRVVVLVPFAAKRGGRLNGYHIGRYPTEGAGRTDRYAPPPGFIEVTPENRGLRVSEHLRLEQFLTHDQDEVWPKYAVVDSRLLDKLELVLDELNRDGIDARRLVVMSGFRTPQYNRRGLGRGRARLSRHQYGDAADVWVDNDGDWYMDDLNGDGDRDTGDAGVMLRAVERIERRFPELAGGAGVYRDNGAHGPFIHIDARGHRARW